MRPSISGNDTARSFACVGGRRQNIVALIIPTVVRKSVEGPQKYPLLGNSVSFPLLHDIHSTTPAFSESVISTNR